MPGATMCAPCLQSAGDIPVLKRLDEYCGDNEKVETFFLDDPRVLRYIRHSWITCADEESFNIAVGDDSHLTREIGTSLGVARNLTTAFEDDDDPILLRSFALPVAA